MASIILVSLLVTVACGSGGAGGGEDVIDKTIRDLAPGHISFITPNTMPITQSRNVVAAISGALPADLTGRLQTDERQYVAPIVIGSMMRVQLFGDNALHVAALSPDWQPVGRVSGTEWDWTVTAEGAGDHQLDLSVQVMLTTYGKPLGSRELQVFSRTVHVTVTFGQLMGNLALAGAQGVLTAFVGQIGIALASLITAGFGAYWIARRTAPRRKRRHVRRPRNPPTGPPHS